MEGDSAFFRHIDINITEYLEDGLGGNMIQGSISLDNETPNMCTEIIPGMHTHDKIQMWYN
jgi:tRNA-dihydrouridine synthase 3